jgi:hypothetical protein
MPLYDKPIRELLVDAVSDLPETFSSEEMVRWFATRYPLIQASSIRAHLRFMSVNVIGRQKNHPSLAQYSLFYKLDRSRYTKYNPAIHGKFDADGRPEGALEDDLEGDLEIAADAADVESGAGFVLEAHLEEFMEGNWGAIDFGRKLRIWSDGDGLTGRQYPTDIGYIDFLCQDTVTGAFVVVELKRDKTSDRVIGQCQRYMGWVKRHLATENQSVEGLVICNEINDKLRYALEVAPNISVRLYRVKFELEADTKPL